MKYPCIAELKEGYASYQRKLLLLGTGASENYSKGVILHSSYRTENVGDVHLYLWHLSQFENDERWTCTQLEEAEVTGILLSMNLKLADNNYHYYQNK
jgi:hypothetical protein